MIGINTAISSQTGSYVGYSFAVPSNIARKVVEGYYGIWECTEWYFRDKRWSALNSKAAEEYRHVNEDTEGFYIGGVEEDSGADKAGIKEGDVIIKKLDNVKILKFSDLRGHLELKTTWMIL